MIAPKTKQIYRFVTCHVRLRAALQEHTRKVAVVELEVSFVVEFEQCRAVGVILLEVEVVQFRLWCRVSTVLTDVHLNIENKC